MDKGVALKFNFIGGMYEEIKQTNSDLVDLIPQYYGYWRTMHYAIKPKENCWAYVTETISDPGRGASGSDTDSTPGSSYSYSYWQPLTKGTIYHRGAREYTVYPIKK